MAEFKEVPTFVRGEPGFAAKLNQLAEAVRELQKAVSTLHGVVEALAPAEAVEAPKPATRRKATAKAE
jgi:outer membrane murein-binding lipoprotein Lpp